MEKLCDGCLRNLKCEGCGKKLCFPDPKRVECILTESVIKDEAMTENKLLCLKCVDVAMSKKQTTYGSLYKPFSKNGDK